MRNVRSPIGAGTTRFQLSPTPSNKYKIIALTAENVAAVTPITFLNRTVLRDFKPYFFLRAC